jgi:hypothetical protein
MKMFSIDEFSTFLSEELAAKRLPHAREVALETASQMIVAQAKSAIGTYTFEWPQLAGSTQVEREREGFPANEPLLRTGAMRDSISYTIDKPGEEATVGSTSEIALWQELGTPKIPPRPFLLPSVFYLEKPIEKMIGEVVVAALAPASIQGEIFKIAAESLGHLGETAKEIVSPDERRK